MQWPYRCTQRLSQAFVRRRFAIIAADVLQPGGELRECVRVDAAVLLKALPHMRAQLVDVFRRSRDADDWQVERSVPDHRLQRRENLLARKVAGGAEKYERVRTRYRCGCTRHRDAAGFSTWPPNACRIADSTRSANSAFPRELKR